MTYPVSQERNIGPCALFGGPLTGESLVRIIYVDEAGRSSSEGVAVVVGVIVHGDVQWHPAVQEVMRTLNKMVPAAVKKGFIYHTTDLIGHKYDAVWPFQDRLTLVHRMARIPNKLGLPLVIGAVRKDKVPDDPSQRDGLTRDQFAEMGAFYLCVSAAGTYLRSYAGRELAMVIAENTDDMRKTHEASLRRLKFTARFVESLDSIARGMPVQSSTVLLHAGQIVGPVSFAPKAEEPLLWLSDVCAYGLRRFYSGLKYGDEYAKSVIGELSQEAIETVSGLTRHGSLSGVFLGGGARPTLRVTYRVYAEPPAEVPSSGTENCLPTASDS
jgi:hypothetical protein